MSDKVLLEKDGRIGRIILNRPDVLNAIDDEVPIAIASRVEQANADPDIHVIVFANLDLTKFLEKKEHFHAKFSFLCEKFKMLMGMTFVHMKTKMTRSPNLVVHTRKPVK